ncbi:hypothetical protein D3C77_410850 [compost metagenome]
MYFLKRRGNHFFRKNMFACSGRGNHNLLMLIRWRVHYNRVQIVLGKHVCQGNIIGDTQFLGRFLSAFGIFIPYRHNFSILMRLGFPGIIPGVNMPKAGFSNTNAQFTTSRLIYNFLTSMY